MTSPLRPVGLHSDEHAPPQVRPADPPEPPSATVTAGPSNTTAAAMVAPSTTVAPSATSAPSATNPANNDDKVSSWWGTLTGKLEELKEWAGELFSAEKDNHPPQ